MEAQGDKMTARRKIFNQINIEEFNRRKFNRRKDEPLQLMARLDEGFTSGLRVPSVIYSTCLLSLLLLLLNIYARISCLLAAEMIQPLNEVRDLPEGLIMLENGSRTFVSISSLEDFLATSTASYLDINSSLSSQEEKESNQSLEREGFSEKTSGETKQNTKESIKLLARDEDVEDKDKERTKKARHEGPTSGEHMSNSNHGKHSDGPHAAETGVVNNKGSNNKTTAKPIPQHWQVKSLLNVTHDYPLEYSQIICGYVWPLMAALTLFTNLMIVFVLTQKDMRTPTNVVLTSIAIADIIPIVVPVPWFVYLFAMGNEKEVLYPPLVCYFYQHSTRSVSEIFYFLSTWLNVLLAVQDYLTACRPKLAKKYCQIKVVVYEIILLTLLAFLLNLPQLFKLVFKPVKFYYRGQLTWGCKAMQAKWFKDLVGEYVALYDDIFTAIIVLFVDGGPAIALITLTALLIRQLQRQRIQGHLLMEQARTASKRRRERHRQQEYEASARVMIFVLLAFLAVKIPFATTYTLMIIQSRFEIHFVENLVDFQKAITLTDLVFVLSYPINFTIFCGCSKKFRHKCAQLLAECTNRTQATRNRFMSSFSGGSFNSDTTLSQIYKKTTDSSLIVGHESASMDRHSVNYDNQAVTLIPSIANYDGSSFTDMGTICCNGTSGTFKKLQQKPPQAQSINRKQSLDHDDNDDMISNPDSGRHRLCPSSQHDDILGSQESARALVEDGLCLECILRYEQMRGGSSVASNRGGGGGGQRRLSMDSNSSWPISLPPPLPPLQFHHLPHIVTTRCESIRERSTSEEQVGDQAPTTGSEHQAHSVVKLAPVDVQIKSLGSLLVTKEAAEAAEAANQSRGRNLTRNASSMRGNSDPGTTRDSIQHIQDTMIYQAYESTARRSTLTNETSPQEANSDRDGQSSGRDRKRAPALSQLGNKDRSLSMSNSKLTALAGATGLLADVLKTTLLSTNSSTQTVSTKNVSSEPVMHHHFTSYRLGGQRRKSSAQEPE